jgi:pimeloyl-ACP methyl ester carboxylesterase
VVEFTEASVWHEYYDAFSYLNIGEIRPLCHPRKFLHPGGADKSVVLIHGLSDSPYSVAAIGRYFYNELGYDVYLPLLQCHGLKNADGMRGVQLAAWKKNVQFAVEMAAADGGLVSIGGLSTGGALAFHASVLDARVNGELFLFSAAFGLYGGKKNLLSPVVEGFLTLPFVPFLTTGSTLFGKNPYRYKRIPLIAARELVLLIDENRRLLQEVEDGEISVSKVFSAWSEADRVVRIDLLNDFGRILPRGNFASFVVPKRADVSHACVVLEEPVYGVGSLPAEPPVEEANPHFYLMMDSMAHFEKSDSLEKR